MSNWDRYAPFYDWENARTMGRRDVAYWTRFASAGRGHVLELGCGTGRIALPISGVVRSCIGLDLSADMLARAVYRARRRSRSTRPRLLRGDIRQLPFASGSIGTVIAAYGVLQSLTSDADLNATLAEVARVMKPGARFGIDLVPDLPSWESYQRQLRFRGTLRGRHVALVESVRQNRRRGLTIFDEEFLVGRGRQAERHTFTLTFRTLPMRDVLARLTAASLAIDAVYGSYRRAAWTEDAETWLVTALKS
jgi:ubiquinone/menaquinone biosynthesis C-methylase UbiE